MGLHACVLLGTLTQVSQGLLQMEDFFLPLVSLALYLEARVLAMELPHVEVPLIFHVVVFPQPILFLKP